jgi:multidrug resistance protein, MATE family
MYAAIWSNVLNVVLNYLLIFGKFGFPELGIIGAAYGTVISRILMVVYLWWLLANKEHSKAMVTNLKFFVLEKLMLKKIINLGAPSAMQMFFEVAIFTAAIWLSGLLGKNPQAANQIALNLSSMTFMVAMGLSVASMIRVGNQKGLKNYIELRRIAFSIFFMAVLLAICFGAIFFVLHKQLPKMIDNLEVVSIASQLLIAAAIFQISDSVQVVVLGALRGLQDVKIPTIITFISYWLIGFPISYYFGKEEQLGSYGIWLGLLAGLSTAAVLLYIRFNYLTLKLIKEQHS